MHLHRSQCFLDQSLNPSTVDIWGWVILGYGDCPGHCGCLATPLTSPHWLPIEALCQGDNHPCLHILPSVPWGAESPQLRTPAPD